MTKILNRSVAFLAVSLLVALGAAATAVLCHASPASLAAITALGGALVGSAGCRVVHCVVELRHERSDATMAALIEPMLHRYRSDRVPSGRAALREAA